MDTGDTLIVVERRRQRLGEGFTLGHDDAHADGELLRAALEYAQTALGQTYAGRKPNKTPAHAWPWEAKWWKPSDDPIRNLVKAGALIAAEIDRLQRAEQEPV